MNNYYSKITMRTWVLLPLLLLTSYLAKASQAEPNILDLSSQAQIADVEDNDYSFSHFLKIQDELPFRALTGSNEDLGFTNHHYWLKFPISNPTDRYKDYYFETARPLTDKVDLYLVGKNGKIEKRVSGDQIPFDERDFADHKSIFHLELPPNAELQAYLHLASDGEVISIPLKLYDTESFIQNASTEQVFYGLFYGMLIFASIFYLFFFISLKERTFMYYGLYVLFIGLLQFSLDGFLFQYLLPSGGWVNSRAVISLALIANFFLIKYAEHFLELKSNLKVVSKIFNVIIALQALTLVGLSISPLALQLSYPMANALGLISILLILGSVFALSGKNVKVDPFFSLGITFFVAGFVVFILNNFGILPTNFITTNSTKFGTGLEVIFLSISMINRIRNLRREKEEIQNTALQHLQDMNDLKSYFMSNMSHELRTPLNAIMGVSDFMIRESTDKKVIENFEVVKYASVGLLSCVNDILDFNKIEKGELKLSREDFAPVDVANDIIKSIVSQAKNKGLNFEYNVDEKAPDIIIGDSERLTQILNNVLNNAIKFTSKGSVRFDMDYIPIDKENGQLKFTVTDTGVGIDKVKQKSVFRSFTQVESDDKRNYGGLGLGLSLVKELVNLHQGTIEIESEPNQGTQCTIFLPYEVKTAPKSSVSLPDSPYDLKNARVLVVEDNPINQMIIKKLLSCWSNTIVDVVNDGKQALEILKSSDFDIILMDLQMPVMDGYEATTNIRNGVVGNDLKTIPIIAVTADTMESTKSRVMDIGMNDYLSKPINQDALYRKITQQLEQSKLSAELKIA
ncbi:7TM diverse intracellular signaling domain-containing protein [Owenweeksia hongkongensis]|uniref:hybrid sensor histidine kinase/response regulator n=1 Tax=Owenweeksia hongkongensis TaxID=253245 RepID=UPI003A9245A8